MTLTHIPVSDLLTPPLYSPVYDPNYNPTTIDMYVTSIQTILQTPDRRRKMVRLSMTSSSTRVFKYDFCYFVLLLGLLTNLTRPTDRPTASFNSGDHTSKCCGYLPSIVP